MNGNNAPDSSDPEEDEQDVENDYVSFFNSFCKQWLHTQLTHHVSLAASNTFWKLSFENISKIFDLKRNENISRKIPQFYQIRKNFYKDNCPEVKMSFAFLDKNDQSIIHVNGDTTPLKEYERNPQYQKLYEEAHIEVIAMFMKAIVKNCMKY